MMARVVFRQMNLIYIDALLEFNFGFKNHLFRSLGRCIYDRFARPFVRFDFFHRLFDCLIGNDSIDRLLKMAFSRLLFWFGFFFWCWPTKCCFQFFRHFTPFSAEFLNYELIIDVCLLFQWIPVSGGKQTACKYCNLLWIWLWISPELLFQFLSYLFPTILEKHTLSLASNHQSDC